MGLLGIGPAIVSLTSGTEPRMRPVLAADQDPPPFSVYQEVGAGPENTLRGAGGFAGPRYQVTSYARSRSAAKARADAIKAVLHGYRGTVTVGADSVTIDGVLCLDGGDVEPADGPQHGRLYGFRYDYRFWFTE